MQDSSHTTGTQPSQNVPLFSVVYFILCGCNVGFIKIGVSDNVRKRISQMQIGSPYSLTLLRTVPGGPQEEAEMHWRFRHLHHHGEWFFPGEDLVNFVLRRRKKPAPKRTITPPPRERLPMPIMSQDEIFRAIAEASRVPPPL